MILLNNIWLKKILKRMQTEAGKNENPLQR